MKNLEESYCKSTKHLSNTSYYYTNKVFLLRDDAIILCGVGWIIMNFYRLGLRVVIVGLKYM